MRGAGLYGSCAKGENTKDSDIDIWVKISNASELELARFSIDTTDYWQRTNNTINALLPPVYRGKHDDNGVYLKTAENHTEDKNPFT